MLFLLVGFIFFSVITPSLSQNVESVKIGLLIRDKNDFATKQAAELAIEHANAKGGYLGRPFELITKSCGGPWGIGSKQAVDLIHEDQVSLVVTALDGRNAHLVEQVAAKSHVVMLSTQSSDPTLSRAYVPWYFRMVPDDRQQAEVLVEEINVKQNFKKVALISLDSYDGNKSIEAMVNLSKGKGVISPQVFLDFDQQQANEFSFKTWDAIVLAGSSIATSKIIEKILLSNKNTKIYAFLNVFNFNDDFDTAIIKKVSYVKTQPLDHPKLLSFKKEYQSKYDKIPSPSLAYVYDGIMLSLESIKKFGPDQENIRIGFKQMEYKGITGKVEFGNLGNREVKLIIE